jgi:hypothetical protein
MIGWAVDPHDHQLSSVSLAKDSSVEEVIAHVHSSNIKHTVPEAKQNTARMTIGWKPTPEKILTHLQTPELLVREVVLDSFLKAHHIYPVNP